MYIGRKQANHKSKQAIEARDPYTAECNEQRHGQLDRQLVTGTQVFQIIHHTNYKQNADGKKESDGEVIPCKMVPECTTNDHSCTGCDSTHCGNGSTVFLSQVRYVKQLETVDDFDQRRHYDHRHNKGRNKGQDTKLVVE